MGVGDMSLLFVYGTLKRNQPNHYLIENISGNKFIRYKFDGHTVLKYPLIISTQFNIPFLLNEPGEGKHVYGQVYDVNESMLNFLDEFEGVPDLYQRLLIEVRPFNKSLQSGEEKDIIKAYAYMRNMKLPNKLSGDQEYLEVYDNSNTTLKYVPHTEVGIDELI